MKMQQTTPSHEFAHKAQFEDNKGLVPVKAIDALVGSRLRTRRKELAMSQAGLALHLGLTFSQVQKYEKGSNRIGAGRLYQLAALLGVPVQYFYKGMWAPMLEAPDMSPQAAIEEDARLHDAVGKVPDPRTRRALFALASSMTERD